MACGQGSLWLIESPTKSSSISCTLISRNHTYIIYIYIYFYGGNHVFVQLLQRTRHNLEEKRRQVEYIGDGVSAEAQKILHSITKT